LFRPETVVLQDKPFKARGDVWALAEGRAIQRVFAGSQQRIRLEVDGLQGVRPVAPAPVYGQRLTHIEALQPSSAGTSDIQLDQSLWIGVRDYHVLNPTGLKILICCEDTPGGEAALAFGARLAEAASGPTTLLTVVDRGEVLNDARETLEAWNRKYFPTLGHSVETRIRQGSSAHEILMEAQDGHHEIVLLGRQRESISPDSRGLGSTTRQVLNLAAVPVLLVKDPRPRIDRILICTAVGEPGKADVRFGGRLARRTGAAATVLHVRRPKSAPRELKFIERHLQQAQRSLEALNVKSETKIKEGLPPLEGILKEADHGDYDLIVIGAPSPRYFHQVRWSDLATQIVAGTSRPVLIVPLVE
jgi:nucleotide-binding universal stress UspA family protein